MIREGGNRFSETIMPNQEYDPAPPFDSGHPDRAPEFGQGRIVGALRQGQSGAS